MFEVIIVGILIAMFLILAISYRTFDKIEIVFYVLHMILLSFVVGISLAAGIEYKQGQIDALTGNIKYELKTNPDSTKTWEKIDE